MRKVFKYELKWRDKVRVDMPRGSQPISVGVQDEALMLWALVDPDEDTNASFSFRVAGTGHPIEEENLDFIGTVHFHDLVFHVFEDLDWR